jgi:hypothetical protein
MWETREVHTGFWWGDLRERGYLEGLVFEGLMVLKLIFKKWDVEMWTGLIWLRIGKDGGRW